MDKIELKCNSCNAPLNLNIEKLSMYCPYCGSKLMFYVEDINKILLEKEKTKQAEIKMQKEKNRLDYMSENNRQATELLKSPMFLLLFAGIFAVAIIMLVLMTNIMK